MVSNIPGQAPLVNNQSVGAVSRQEGGEEFNTAPDVLDLRTAKQRQRAAEGLTTGRHSDVAF